MKNHLRNRLRANSTPESPCLPVSSSPATYANVATQNNGININVEELNPSHRVFPDGCLSQSGTTAIANSTEMRARVSFSDADASTDYRHHWQVNDNDVDVVALQRQIEAIGMAKEEADRELLQAKLNEASIHQTHSALISTRKELKEKLQIVKDEINIAKQEQGEAAAETRAKEQQKYRVQAQLDIFLSQLFAARASELSRDVPSPQSHIDDATLPVLNGNVPIPRRHKEARARQDGTLIDSAAPPKKLAKTEKTNDRITVQQLLILSQDSAQGDRAATSRLIDVVTTTPTHELRRIMGIPNQTYTRGLDSYFTIELLRVLCRGQAQLRPDLNSRLQNDPEAKRWIASSRGKLRVGHLKDDAQQRLNYILNVPPTSS